MISQDEASKYLYILFGDFMKRINVSETDKDWIYAQVIFARAIDLISDNECKMMTDSINEKKSIK